MYGVLRGNGEIIPLPGVEAACIEGDDLICFDADGTEVARYPSNGSMFGAMESLEHIVRRLARLEAYSRLERLASQR